MSFWSRLFKSSENNTELTIGQQLREVLIREPDCDHDYKYVSYGNAVPTRLLRCSKCKYEVRNESAINEFLANCDHEWVTKGVIKTCQKCDYTT
ncbi:hypothetical protein SP15_226 [Bacillus phage SP-15]|uniref:Uncharacterized protein n=1 Tax=Bacillus phage SP-15 TaxID=1792032 RepID=A0A127AWI7_9CAUD|nr:hypothetical protein SP15_226 [Bacillus phage SP-15]AMM45028.1 hypothetical protein SP15_226 [Bacillus phage SP-15]